MAGCHSNHFLNITLKMHFLFICAIARNWSFFTKLKQTVWSIHGVPFHLKFVGVWSKHLRVFLESFRQSSIILEIFGYLRKFSIFGNLRKVVANLRNIVKNVVISMGLLVRYCSWHSSIKFISSRHRVISSIYFMRSTCLTHHKLRQIWIFKTQIFLC